MFAFLSPQDLRRAAQVSKKWRKLILGLSENYAAVAPAPASPSASAVADDFSTLARGSVSPLDVHANMLITPRTFTLVRFFSPFALWYSIFVLWVYSSSKLLICGIFLKYAVRE